MQDWANRALSIQSGSGEFHNSNLRQAGANTKWLVIPRGWQRRHSQLSWHICLPAVIPLEDSDRGRVVADWEVSARACSRYAQRFCANRCYRLGHPGYLGLVGRWKISKLRFFNRCLSRALTQGCANWSSSAACGDPRCSRSHIPATKA